MSPHPLPHLPHLTGVRAVAAYLVLFGHFMDARFVYAGVSLVHEFASVFACFGMTVFFVLSGFVITYSYGSLFQSQPWPRAVWGFFVARFARLYPLYLFSMLAQIYWVAPAMYHASGMERISFATLTQSWWNVQHITFANAWSISTECFFYLAFALFMGYRIFRRPKPPHTFEQIRRAVWLFSVAFLLLLAICFSQREAITQALTPLVSHPSNRLVWGWFYYFFPLTRIGEFILGALAATLYMRAAVIPISQAETQRSRRLCLLSLAGIFGMGVYYSTHLGYDNFLFFLANNFGIAPFLAYLFYATSRNPNFLTRWWSSRLMQTGGDISYSLYMMQFVIFYSFLIDLFPKPAGFEVTTSEWIGVTLSVFVYMGIVTLVALCTYRFVEVPSRRILRKLSRKILAPMPQTAY